MPALDSNFSTHPAMSSVQAKTILPDDALAARAEGEIALEGSSSTKAGSSRSEAVVMVQPPAPNVPTSSSDRTVRVLGAEEIELLRQRGEEFLAAGDVLAARIAFQRAAEAGDGDAAVALGATYDPIELAKLGVVGMTGDVVTARTWYQKAKEFGSREATGRLERFVGR
jgi:TPR repeat protein